jgi:TetR/AcrR family acrAB operon transcriptional repressor
MVRRTKEDALATRHALLDAAERMFQAKGVSGTSLADIAAAAGTTRGAIYWHFKDKADLFNAMMERVTLPMEHALAEAGLQRRTDPLPLLRASLMRVLHQVATDERARRVFEVATHKVEYVDELGAVRSRHLAVRNECVGQVESVLRTSARLRGCKLAVPAAIAARGLHALVDGLIQNWLLDSTAFDLRRVGGRSLDAYLSGIGLQAA